MNPEMPDLTTELSTSRLSLRAYRVGDGEVYARALLANRDHLREFMPPLMADIKDESDAEKVIAWFLSEWEKHTLFNFSVWDKVTGDYMGEAYLANADWHVPCIEVGYFVLKAYNGKGIATEAAQALIQFAFERLGVIRVELQCASDNTGSVRVAEKCGFCLEGRQRQRNRKKDGTVVDRLWYGLLRSEWEAMN